MRAQSHVVGVALLLGMTAVALGGLTVTVGELVESGTASADAARVADQLDTAIQPVETTGPRTARVHFADGSLHSVDREIRVLEDGSVVASHAIGGLVFESGDRRVASVAGAVVRGQPGAAWVSSRPPVLASNRTGVLVVGVSQLGVDDVAIGGEGTTAVRLATNVSHARTDLGEGNFSVAVETATPRPFERYFEGQNATVARQDFDGDGVESVVAEYPGQRRGYLVVHDLSLEVADG